MDKSVKIRESHQSKDNLVMNQSSQMGVQRTKIIIKDHNTGEILQEVENKILVPASQVMACRMFGLDQLISFPSYNKELGLDNSEPEGTEPENTPYICLWCAGRSGSGSSPNEVVAVKVTDRISPTADIVPFRYVTSDTDLAKELREDTYFGRKVDGGSIAYYFKAFDTRPELRIKYLDGTDVTGNMYTVSSEQSVETYVEMKFSISRLDFRDYFDRVLGWDNADISTISLCMAWNKKIVENEDADEEDQFGYLWYQDILPVSKLNFRSESLTDLNRAIDFTYQIFY